MSGSCFIFNKHKSAFEIYLWCWYVCVLHIQGTGKTKLIAGYLLLHEASAFGDHSPSDEQGMTHPLMQKSGLAAYWSIFPTKKEKY